VEEKGRHLSKGTNIATMQKITSRNSRVTIGNNTVLYTGNLLRVDFKGSRYRSLSLSQTHTERQLYEDTD
jgi:hypothetical protein